MSADIVMPISTTLATNTQTPAFAYVRVSSRGQVDGDGFERQMTAIGAFAAANGISVVKTFQEEGVSGTVETRAALTELLIELDDSAGTPGDTRIVLIEKLDRLSRDLMVQEGIIKRFQQLGVVLMSAIEGPDLLSNDPTRKFIRQVLGAVAELDKSLLVERLRVARVRKKKRDGKCEGRRGLAATQPDVLHLIYRLCDQPMTFPDGRIDNTRKHYTHQQVADYLNVQGHKSADGKKFTKYIIGNILRGRK